MNGTLEGPSALAISARDNRVVVLAVNAVGAASEIEHQTHLSRFQEELADAPHIDHTTLPGLLGTDDLRMEAVEIFAIKDIEAMGLVAYLQEAYDIPQERLQADSAKLSALDGTIIVLGLSALGNGAQEITLPPELSLIGAYEPDRTDFVPKPMPTTQNLETLNNVTEPVQTTGIPHWLIWGFILKFLLILGVITLVIVL